MKEDALMNVKYPALAAALLLFCSGQAAELKIDLSKYQIGQDPATDSRKIFSGVKITKVAEVDGAPAVIFPAKNDSARTRFAGLDIMLPNLASKMGADFSTEKNFQISFEVKVLNTPTPGRGQDVGGINLRNYVRLSVGENGDLKVLVSRKTKPLTVCDDKGIPANLKNWTKIDIRIYPAEKKAILIVNGVLQCEGKFDYFMPEQTSPQFRINPSMNPEDSNYLQFAIRNFVLNTTPAEVPANLPKSSLTLASLTSEGRAMQMAQDIAKVKIPDLKDVKSGQELLWLNSIQQAGSRAPWKSWGSMAAGGKGVFTFSPLPGGSTLCRMDATKGVSRMQYGISGIPDVSKFDGQLVTFHAMVKGENISGGEGPVVRIALAGIHGDGTEITFAPRYKNNRPGRVEPTLGTFDWTPVTGTFRLPERIKSVTVLNYLMNSSGILEWKDVSLKYTPEVKNLTHPAPVAFLDAEGARKKAIAAGERHINMRKAELIKQFGKIPSGSEFYTPKPALSAPHPRLLPLGIPLSEIQKRAQDPRYERIVKAIKRQADGFCKLNPQKPNMEVEDPLRSLGDAPQWLLVAYVIETDPAAKAVYKENLYRYVNLLLDWGLPKQDLPVAHAQLSLALTYDWLYNELPKELRDRIRLRLIEAARYAIGLEWVGCYMWRYGQFLANHNWFVHKIMGLAAVTLWTEDGDPLKPGELKNLLDEMVANFYFVEGVHSADGHPVEGPLYQDYGLRPFYDVATIITPLLNMKYDMLKAPVIKEQAPARLSTLLPGTTGFMVYSDSKPEQYSGATFWYLLASIHNDPVAQRLGDLCRERLGEENLIAEKMGPQYLKSNAWRELFFYNPDIKPAAADSLPLFRNGEHLGLYMARSSWSDPEAAFIGIRCGDAVGSDARKFMGPTLSNGHCYPEQGNFSFYVGNDQVIPGMEYAREKMTTNHNLAVFKDDRKGKGAFIGQAGEGGAWFDVGEVRVYKLPAGAPSPKVYKKENTPGYSAWFCDLGPYYFLPDKNGKLTVNPDYKRLLVFLPEEKSMVVVDKIALDTPRDTKLRLLSGANGMKINNRDFIATMKNGNRYILRDHSPEEYKRSCMFENVMSWTNTARNTAELLAPNMQKGIFAVAITPEKEADKISVRSDEKGVIISIKGKKDLQFAW